MMAFDNIEVEKFYVLQFLIEPYPNNKKFACVPISWIERKSTDGSVYVAYPNEDLAKTRRCAENNVSPEDHWKIIKAKVVYESVDFQDADSWAAAEEFDELDLGYRHVIDHGQSTDDEEFISVEEVSSDDSEYIIHIRPSRNGSSNLQTGNELRVRSNKIESAIEWDVEGLFNVLNKVKITDAAMPTSSNQSHQSSKSPHQRRLLTKRPLSSESCLREKSKKARTAISKTTL